MSTKGDKIWIINLVLVMQQERLFAAYERQAYFSMTPIFTANHITSQETKRLSISVKR